MTKALLLASAALLCAAPALADDAPPPDKSNYTLFNPVPDDEMRSFSTDRPTKSDTPYTVDAGHYQYETDILNWSYNRNSTTTSNLLVADPVLKAGLTNSTDLEIALAPFNFNQSHVRGTTTKNTAAGFGDFYARVKYNVLGNDGGDYAVAVVPYVKAPTAAHNVGNGHWEGGGYVPFVAALPYDVTVVLSDWVIVKITAAPGSSFLDRMIALVEGAVRQKTPNEIALNILLAGMTIIFVFVVVTIPSFVAYAKGAVAVATGAQAAGAEQSHKIQGDIPCSILPMTLC